MKEAPRSARQVLAVGLLAGGAVCLATVAIGCAWWIWDAGAARRSAAVFGLAGALAVGGLALLVGWALRHRRERVADDHPSATRAGGSVGEVPGRTALVEALGSQPSGGDRNGVALVFVRLDRLDLINHRLGRDAGDEVLRQVAARLQRPDHSDETFGRIGTSTFAVVRCTSDGAIEWAEGLRGAVAEPVTLGVATIHPTCAMALVTTDGFHQDGVSLFDDAEHLARGHLQHGRAEVEHLRLGLGGDARDLSRLELAPRVAAAVARGEIVAEYQPVVELRTMEVVGVEALARWRDAAPGVGEPRDFLELVAALGLGPELLDQILRQVASDFGSGPAAERGWWVSVNLSTEDCTDPTLPARVEAAIQEGGLDPARLVLEVSERAIPDPGVERALRQLADLGVKLAIDDFGSGWSSLAQLRSLPISLLKLDRVLVSQPSVSDAQLTMATVALANALGVETLAEGVETGEDLLLLCLAECNYGQGFWWSQAAPLAEVLERFPAATMAPTDDATAAVIDLAVVRDAAARVEVDRPAPEVEELLEMALREQGDADDPLVAYLEQQLEQRANQHDLAPLGAPPEDREVDPVDARTWLDLTDEEFIDAMHGKRSGHREVQP